MMEKTEKNANITPVKTQENSPAENRKATSLVDVVQNRIEEMTQQGEINFPPNYSVSNALRTAWLTIQETRNKDKRPALEVCTRDSVMNALLNTVIQGLNPAKKQIYYIVYDDQLQAQRSYFGTMAVTKRVPGIKGIFADVVWKNDVFETRKEMGNWVITKHESSVENIGDTIEDIKAAYCTIVFEGGETYTEIMNKKQIEKSWSHSKSREQTVHKEFPDQMAKRTVINRACKFFMNTSDDSDLLLEAFNATGDKYEDRPETQEEEKSRDSRLDSLNAEISKSVAEPKEDQNGQLRTD